MGIAKNVMEAGATINALLVVGFFGLIWLIIYGNLSGNTGFAAGSVQANDTQSIINNMTAGTKTFFSFSNIWFTAAAITLLIFIFLGILGIVMRQTKMLQGGKGENMGKYSGY